MLFNPQKIRPPHFILGFLLFAIILHELLKPAPWIPRPLNWSGFVVLIAGIVLMATAHGFFDKKGTPVSHAETPQGVVTDGVYRFSRNPMYVAGALIFLGIALMVGTWPFFLSWLLIGAVLHFVFIPWEEQRMEELFGEEYLTYKTRTKRWL